MTVNVLKESAKIENLKVHGIEYRATSTADANNILPQLLPIFGGAGASLGAPICRGDATDLFFVPSNAFDLALTGKCCCCCCCCCIDFTKNLRKIKKM